MPTFKDVLQQVKSQIKEIKVQELQEKLKAKERFLLLDVRERDEVADGMIDGAEAVPRGLLDLKIEDMAPDKSQQVVIYCAGGTRSALAARTLNELGYADVISVEGGFGAWKRAGYSFSMPRALSQDSGDSATLTVTLRPPRRRANSRPSGAIPRSSSIRIGNVLLVFRTSSCHGAAPVGQRRRSAHALYAGNGVRRSRATVTPSQGRSRSAERLACIATSHDPFKLD
jgi:rhodanese-related sulfurtransferase